MTPAPPRPPSEPDAVFVFPGQGIRPQGALAALYYPAERVPARALDAADQVLAEVDGVAAEHGYGSIGDVLRHAGQEEHLPYGVGPLACFAASVALAHALEAAGIVPRLLIGYSLGEFAALVYAGAFTVSEGTGLVCSLNTAYAPETGRGGCLLVDASEDGARELLRRTGSHDVVVACVNAPEQTVVSGPRYAIEALLALDSPPHPRLHRLPIPYAAHHPCLQGVADTFLRLGGTTPQRPLRRPTVSTARRRPCTDDDPLVAGLAACVTEPARFLETLHGLPSRTRTGVFVETGVGDALTRSVCATWPRARALAPLAADGAGPGLRDVFRAA
ncbi:acyltransferase domain-containing protein [Streptomyces sp. NPDC005876]|uniref:acyltransferase domain-containing protein n=1 Tax=unclassified Streptomyces TaxID=2593676 RepID=UPI00340124AE